VQFKKLLWWMRPITQFGGRMFFAPAFLLMKKIWLEHRDEKIRKICANFCER
jgi:hypothetical protein